MKFGIVFFILMFSFYIYWAICLYRYRYALSELGDPMSLNMLGGLYDAQPPMMDPVVGVPPPPPPPPPQVFPHSNFNQHERPTIILTNERPS
ncbi:hypothetical protein K501DRAFT_283878 [Backusella circina FSU 941]|nr:hypothetical protein K501DRAFT_283878 [Backusella circina FSU 941]